MTSCQKHCLSSDNFKYCCLNLCIIHVDSAPVETEMCIMANLEMKSQSRQFILHKFFIFSSVVLFKKVHGIRIQKYLHRVFCAYKCDISMILCFSFSFASSKQCVTKWPHVTCSKYASARCETKKKKRREWNTNRTARWPQSFESFLWAKIAFMRASGCGLHLHTLNWYPCMSKYAHFVSTGTYYIDLSLFESVFFLTKEDN